MLVAVAFTLAIGVLYFLNFSVPGIFMIGGIVALGKLRLGLLCLSLSSALLHLQRSSRSPSSVLLHRCRNGPFFARKVPAF